MRKPAFYTGEKQKHISAVHLRKLISFLFHCLDSDIFHISITQESNLCGCISWSVSYLIKKSMKNEFSLYNTPLMTFGIFYDAG